MPFQIHEIGCILFNVSKSILSELSKEFSIQKNEDGTLTLSEVPISSFSDTSFATRLQIASHPLFRSIVHQAISLLIPSAVDYTPPKFNKRGTKHMIITLLPTLRKRHWSEAMTVHFPRHHPNTVLMMDFGLRSDADGDENVVEQLVEAVGQRTDVTFFVTHDHDDHMGNLVPLTSALSKQRTKTEIEKIKLVWYNSPRSSKQVEELKALGLVPRPKGFNRRSVKNASKRLWEQLEPTQTPKTPKATKKTPKVPKTPKCAVGTSKSLASPSSSAPSVSDEIEIKRPDASSVFIRQLNPAAPSHADLSPTCDATDYDSRSMVLHVEVNDKKKKHVFLNLGDYRYTKTPARGPIHARVVKVPHHGSVSASTPALWSAVHADCYLFTNSKDLGESSDPSKSIVNTAVDIVSTALQRHSGGETMGDTGNDIKLVFSRAPRAMTDFMSNFTSEQWPVIQKHVSVFEMDWSREAPLAGQLIICTDKIQLFHFLPVPLSLGERFMWELHGVIVEEVSSGSMSLNLDALSRHPRLTGLLDSVIQWVIPQVRATEQVGKHVGKLISKVKDIVVKPADE